MDDYIGSKDDFSPISDIYKSNDFLSEMNSYGGKKIAQLIISHPHLDHISDLTEDNATFIQDNSSLITCQNDKNDSRYLDHKIDFSLINNPADNCEQIENFKNLYSERNLPLVTMNSNIDGLDFKFGYYYLTHKQIDEHIRSARVKKDYYDDYSENEKQDYTNSLSIVLYLNYYKMSLRDCF